MTKEIPAEAQLSASELQMQLAMGELDPNSLTDFQIDQISQTPSGWWDCLVLENRLDQALLI